MISRAFKLATLLSLVLPGIAVADDAAITDRIDRAFYLDASVAPVFLSVDLHGSTAAAAPYSPRRYFGLGGNLGVCAAGVGIETVDLCGGVTGFVVGGSQTFSDAGVSSSATFKSFGGYAEAKVHVGDVTLAPFAGYRSVKVDGSEEFGAVTIDYDISPTGVVFGGADVGWRVSEKMELGVRGEYGRSTSTAAFKDFSYGSAAAYLRFRF